MRRHKPWWTVTVGALCLVGSAFAAPSPTLHYRLNGHDVQVPPAATGYVGPEGLFVTATRESLQSALEAAGWTPNANLLQGAWVFAQPSGDGRTVAALGDRVLAWAVSGNKDGPGHVWFVRLVHLLPAAEKTGLAAPPFAAPRADADLALKAVFLTGTSRLAAAVPAQRKSRRLAWVRLRHAPGELQLARPAPEGAWGTTEGGEQAQGSAEALTLSACVDVPALPPTDAPDKNSFQPNPEVGPACESHGSLPLHPLVAKKVTDWVVWHSAPSTKQVALTFDACSTFAIGRFNPRVVAMLRAHKVPATLFVGGHWAEMYPDVLEDLAQDPLFEIGNHTYSHPHMRDLSPQTQRQELLWTQALIFKRTGKTPRLFRPPYGEIDDTLVTTAAQSGLYTVEYDLPAGDADDHVTKAHLTNWVVGHSNPGSIVVMHMCRPNTHTADALPHIVRQLREQGYKFCQVSDMLFHGGKDCQ